MFLSCSDACLCVTPVCWFGARAPKAKGFKDVEDPSQALAALFQRVHGYPAASKENVPDDVAGELDEEAKEIAEVLATGKVDPRSKWGWRFPWVCRARQSQSGPRLVSTTHTCRSSSTQCV